MSLELRCTDLREIIRKWEDRKEKEEPVYSPETI
jgi:hypothetical protein